MQKSYCGSIESLDKRIALAAGEPDPSFGVAGSVVFGDGRNSTQGMAALDDGRVVIAGSHDGNLSMGPFTRLRRFRGDGSADRTFDGDGQRTLDLLPGDETVQAIAAAGHGKLLLHVTGDGAGAIVRLNSNGSLDRAFGVNGKVISPLLDTPFYYDSFIRVPAGGKILVAQTYDTGGVGTYLGIRLLRFSDTGVPDAGFGTNGIVETGQGSASHPTDLRIRRADGRITVGCSPYADGASIFHFDATGTAIGSLYVNRFASGVKLLPNDRSLIYYAGGNTQDMVITRVLADGSDDLSFGTNGSTTITNPGSRGFEAEPAPLIRTDGKIVLVGRLNPSTSPPQSNFYTLTADGHLDRTFDGDGIATIKHPLVENVIVAASQLNNRILFAGGADFSIARITTGGKLDRSFSSDGFVLPEQFNGFFADSLPLADGRIVAVGYTGRVNPKLILTRFLGDGTIDTSFGTSSRDGFSEVSPPASVFGSAKLYRRSDGRIVVLAGESRIYRFSADGRLQTSYAFTPAEAVRRGDLTYTDLGWQADGKRLSVIYETTTGDYPEINAYLVRINLDGSVDPTFGNNGRISFGSGEGTGELLQTVQLTDGKLLIVSRAGYQVNLSRRLPNGQQDPSFNSTAIADNYGAGQIALDHLGRIVIRTDYAVHRRLSNGDIDTSFSTISFQSESEDVLPATVRVDSTGNIILAGGVNRFVADTTRFGIARFFGD